MSIKIENTVSPSPEQWKMAVMGARNALNSWARYDSCIENGKFTIGENDYGLLMRLRNAGTDHRKFMRMLPVLVDIIAPLYFWKEVSTYKVGTVANSCSTMHKIADKEFSLEDFSHEQLFWYGRNVLIDTIGELNYWRDIYIHGGSALVGDCHEKKFKPKSKEVWWQMIQLLPSSYNQRRTIMLNYEVLANIYKSRKDHKLDEWRVLCNTWIPTLPYSELITGGKNEN